MKKEIGNKKEKDLSYNEFLELLRNAPDTSENINTCPVSRTLNILKGRWRLEVLFYLSKRGTCRFGEISKAYPQVSKTMLSAVLKQLEKDGLITRKQYAEIPVRTEYSLTEAGEAFMPVFYEMFKWGIKYTDGNFTPWVN